MSESVIVALVTVIGSCLTSFSLVNWRLQALEKKIEEHNAWGAKFAQQNTDIELIRKDIEYIKEKLS